jgi:hypothetical protein
MINPRLLRKVEKLLRFNVSQFLNDADVFFNQDYPNIYSYFDGEEVNQTLLKVSYDNFEKLQKDSNKLSELILSNSNNFVEYEVWNLSQAVDDIRVKLKTIKNLSKWLRSTSTSIGFDNGTNYSYTMKNGDTFDKSVKNNLGDVEENIVNDMALKNSIEERDYSLKGGKNIEIYTSNSFASVSVTSMIDNPIGERIYGLDLSSTMRWNNDDLEVLSHDQTLEQTINIHANTVKGSIPENIGLGLDVFIGKNVRVLSKALIIRQLNEIFSVDDLFAGIEIKEIRNVQDSIYINYNIKTILGEVKNNNTIL